MCNYTYVNALPHSYKGSTDCPVPGLFKEGTKRYKKNAKDDRWEVSEIPIDQAGRCVFHSEDVVFKEQHLVYDRFHQLLKLLQYKDGSTAKRLQTINLSEFSVGIKAKDKEVDFVLEIEALQLLNTEVYFDHSKFFRKMAFYNCQFLMVSFANCSFDEDVDFFDTSFVNGNFHRIAGQKRVSLEASRFINFVDFSYSDFFMGFNLTDCFFEKQAIFTHCTFRKNEYAPIAKFNAQFLDFADFTDCVFEIFAIFDYCLFAGEVNFTNSQFKSRFFVQKSEIKGNFFLKGLSNGREVFQDLVDFDLDPENVTGKIIFENVSFLKINEAHKAMLLALAKANRVEIGKGCIKYRLQTPDKKLPLNADKQSIVLAFAQSFVNYFLKASGTNLGLEVRERAEDSITYFLFSDEDISKEVFLERLSAYEQDFLKLLLLNEEEERSMSKVDSLINRVDAFAALLSNFIRVGARISVGKWEKVDTKRLIGAISFTGTSTVDGDTFHEYIALRFGDARTINQYFFGDYTGMKLEAPHFSGGNHQFADQIVNNNPNSQMTKLAIMDLMVQKKISLEDIRNYLDSRSSNE